VSSMRRWILRVVWRPAQRCPRRISLGGWIAVRNKRADS
jgi:hypothetical protein